MVRRKDFQKVAALIHEFLLKLGDGIECAELRDALNLALFHLQRYYRLLQKRLNSTLHNSLQETFHVYGSTTFSQDPEDKFTWKWIDLEKSGTSERRNPDADRVPELLCASQMGDNGLIVQIIEQGNGSELHESDVLGRSALMYAVNSSQLDTVEFLLNQGISVNSTALDGATALHWACRNGNDEALEIILQYGADVTIGDAFGRMPIHWAAVCQDTKCLQLLLDHGADVSATDHDGMTPSMWASHVDCTEHLMLLQGYLEKGKLERDGQGRTWVHWSVRRSEPLCCLTKLLNDDLSSICDDEGKTVMHIAAELGSLPAIRVILSISGNHCLEQRDHSNRTPLILATMAGHGESVNLLLAEGADAASVDECDATAWDYARARQLHYCMLIIASYIRQQQKPDDVSSPDGTTNNAQFPVAGKKALERKSDPIRSLPHPPAPSNYPTTEAVRTPRFTRLRNQTSHASENVEDDSEHISAFRKVPGRRVDHAAEFENSEANHSLRDEKRMEEERGNGRERKTNQNAISQDSKPDENKRKYRNKTRNSSTQRRNGRRPIDNDDNDKDWTTEESDGDVRPRHSLNRDNLSTPVATRRRQSVSRERQMVMTPDAKSGAIVRPMNPATKYYDLKDEYSATDEDNNEGSQDDDGGRVNPGINSFTTAANSNNAEMKKSRTVRPTQTHAPVAAQRQPQTQLQTQQRKFAINAVDSEEMESDIDDSMDEVMAGYRNGARGSNSQSRTVDKTLNKQGTSQGTRTGRQGNRSQSAAQTDGRIMKSVAMAEPPAKFHTRHPGRRKEEQVTSPPPEPRHFAQSRDEQMPLSPGSEAKSRPRMASVPSKSVRPTPASGAFTSSPRTSGVGSMSPRGIDRPQTGAADNSRRGHSNSGVMMVNNRRKDSANNTFLTSHQMSPRIQSGARRRPQQGYDDEGDSYENRDDDEEEENRSSEDDSAVQFGQIRSSHQLRGPLSDNRDGAGLRRNAKGPLQNGPLENAQPSKDGWHLSPLIVPQRAKLTVARIPPVMNVTPSTPVLQKVSEIQTIRKQPNGQLPSTKFR